MPFVVNYCRLLKNNYCFKAGLKQFTLSLFFIIIGVFLSPNLAYFSTLTDEKIIELTNQERIASGLNPVTANQLLTKAAYDKARAIFAAQEFRHNLDGIKFSTWIKNAGYNYSYVGENLALDFITSEGAIAAWMKSPTHKKNILNNSFQEIGIAIMEGLFRGRQTALIIQIFGAPTEPNIVSNTASISGQLSVLGRAQTLNSEKLTVAYQNNALLYNPSGPGLNLVYVPFTPQLNSHNSLMPDPRAMLFAARKQPINSNNIIVQPALTNFSLSNANTLIANNITLILKSLRDFSKENLSWLILALIAAIASLLYNLPKYYLIRR